MANEKIFSKEFIKLSKNILEWEWYSDLSVCKLYIHILLKANSKENFWKGIKIDVGEFVSTIYKLHIETGISIQSIRTALKKLENTNYITLIPTNKFTLIKVNNCEECFIPFKNKKS